MAGLIAKTLLLGGLASLILPPVLVVVFVISVLIWANQ